MGTVRFQLEADQAKAVQAFLKVVDAQNKNEAAFKKTAKSARGLDATLIGTAKRFAGIGAAIGGVAGTTALLASMGQSFITNTRRIGTAALQAEKDMRGFFALGTNARDVAKLRDSIFAQSTAFDQSVKSISDARFFLQSILGDNNKIVSDAIFDNAALVGRLGGDVTSAINLSASAWKIYGKELERVGVTANRLPSLLLAATDAAKATPDQFASFAPQALAAAAARGVNPFNTLALLGFGSGIVGNPSEAGTNIRNLINRVDKGSEVLGIDLQGTIIDKLRKVNEIAGGEMRIFQQIFETELAGFAKVVAQNADEIQRRADDLRKTGPGLISQKLSGIRSDPVSLNLDILSSAKQLGNNIDALQAKDPATAKRAILFQAAQIEAKRSNPAISDIAARAFAAEVVVAGEGSPAAQRSIRLLESQIREGGDDELADATRLTFGRTFGFKKGTRLTQTGVASGTGGVGFEDVGFTGPEDAQSFMRANRDGASVELDQFVKNLRAANREMETSKSASRAKNRNLHVE